MFLKVAHKHKDRQGTNFSLPECRTHCKTVVWLKSMLTKPDREISGTKLKTRNRPNMNLVYADQWLKYFFNFHMALGHMAKNKFKQLHISQTP